MLGPKATATTVAKIIAEARGKRVQPGKPQRIYELHHVDFPRNPPAGKLRMAQNTDVDVIGEWLHEFARETGHGPGDARSYALAHVTGKTMFVWEEEGEPRTTALWAAKTPHGVRIGFVYTPPEFRGRGYASICVAEASQRALNAGYSFCCLYTDLTNATSNGIYQKLGYRPVADVYDVDLVD